MTGTLRAGIVLAALFFTAFTTLTFLKTALIIFTCGFRHALAVGISHLAVDPETSLTDSERTVVAVLRALVYLHHRRKPVEHRMTIIGSASRKHFTYLSRLVIRQDLSLIHDHDFVRHCERLF